jgi:hypothetical protein
MWALHKDSAALSADSDNNLVDKLQDRKLERQSG